MTETLDSPSPAAARRRPLDADGVRQLAASARGLAARAERAAADRDIDRLTARRCRLLAGLFAAPATDGPAVAEKLEALLEFGEIEGADAEALRHAIADLRRLSGI